MLNFCNSRVRHLLDKRVDNLNRLHFAFLFVSLQTTSRKTTTRSKDPCSTRLGLESCGDAPGCTPGT